MNKIRVRAEKVIRESKNARKLHWSMQKNMAALGRELGLNAWTEKNVHNSDKYELGEEAVYNGIIDVIWTDQDSKEIVAIEIDASPRARSVRKLNERMAPISIWIYYGKKSIEFDTSQFIVIQPPYHLRYAKKGRPKPKPMYPITVSAISS